MRISIFGMGYVGSVTAACLAKEGNEVIGVDISREKVDQLSTGRSPIVEEKIGEIIADTIAEGRLRVTLDARAAVNETDVSMICVGTPSAEHGDVDLTYVKRVAEKIGQILKNKKRVSYDHHSLYGATRNYGGHDYPVAGGLLRQEDLP